MRKQYHFWPGEDGLDVWDVDRLIQLSAAFPIKQVDLSSIDEVDTVYWFDPATDPPTVRRVIDHVQLIQEVDLSHPIIFAGDGRVMDGMHRVARAILEGHTTIKAVRFEKDPEPDYRNVQHPDNLPYH